jgi:hypothetical protein
VSRTIVGRLLAVVALMALALPLALGPRIIGPFGAGLVDAASPRLTLVGTARYTVQPDKRRVHVAVDLVVANHAPETITTRYVFDHANLAVLPGTTGFRATDGATEVALTVASRSASSTLLSIHFAKRLAGGNSTTLHLDFELPDPGGAPSRAVRVGPSLVAFPVWAFGSPGVGGSSVSVRFPSGYEVSVGAGKLGRPTTAPDGTTSLSSGSLADPFSLSGYVLADRPGAFRETPLEVTLPNGAARFTIRAWADDPAWATKTAALLRKALPALAARIGLPYPRPAPVVVEESVARAIDGQAGVYDPTSATIRMAYTADPLVVLHEAAHLWFDGSTYADRWIAEGLAGYAADAAASELKLTTAGDSVGIADPSGVPVGVAFPLNAWPADPARDADAQEAYGYAASTNLVRLIVGRVGADGLRAILSAAAARPGGAPIDWRGLLDLVQSEAGVDATDLWRTWVARPEDAALLDQRAVLLAQHDQLVTQAAGWALAPAIAADLRAWRFDDAAATMTSQGAVLAERDDLAVAAAVAGLDPPPNLRTAFEAGDPDAATAEARVERAIVDQIVAAQAAGADASTSWLVRFGLVGQDPVAELDAARVAFAAGDLSAAQARAIGAREAWAGASDLGGLRLRTVAAVGLIFALLVLLLATRARRRPRRARTSYRTGVR